MNTLVWFRNNLRITDNISLQKACKAEKTIGVYFFDPRQFSISDYEFKKTGKYRTKFLIESVANLKSNLKKINIPLYIFNSKPEEKINEILIKHKISTIYLQTEWTRDENLILNNVKKVVSNTIKFIESYDQFLFQPEDIPFNNLITIPNIFTEFRKQCEKHGNIRAKLPVTVPSSTENYFDPKTEIPSMTELGFQDFEIDERTAFPFTGGEDSANERLSYYLWKTKKIATYKKTRNGLLGIDYSSKLSAWLANGCLSPVTIFHEIKKFEKEVIKNQDTYWLFFELIWRDYFKYISLKYKSKIFKLGGILNKSYYWNNDLNTFNSWANGTTKEPFVNANMIELAQTGWMSNRGRQNVASYWAKELQQDWRIGAAYFESMLIDYDVHSNWCNWMYLSGVGNDPRDRKFNIKRQAEHYDTGEKYQNLWLD